MSRPLEKILVSADDVKEEVLVDVLGGLVQVDKDTGDLMFTVEFDALKSKERVMVYFLACKARRLLGLSKDEMARTTVIAAETGIPVGTVGRILRELFGARLLSQSKNLYFIPPHALRRVLSTIKEARKREQGEASREH